MHDNYNINNQKIGRRTTTNCNTQLLSMLTRAGSSKIMGWSLIQSAKSSISGKWNRSWLHPAELKLRRGTATGIAAFTGAAGEVTPDTTNNRLVLHDGTTAGGHPVASEAYVDDALLLVRGWAFSS